MLLRAVSDEKSAAPVHGKVTPTRNCPRPYGLPRAYLYAGSGFLEKKMAVSQGTHSEYVSTSLRSERNCPRDRVLRPLAFPELKADLSCFYNERKDVPIPCLLCKEQFAGEKAREEFLQHSFSAHKIVIDRTCDIVSFKWCVLRCVLRLCKEKKLRGLVMDCSYAEYWRRRLAVDEIKNIMAVINTQPSTQGMVAQALWTNSSCYRPASLTSLDWVS